MIRTMSEFMWLVICGLICHSTDVFCFKAILSSNEGLAHVLTENYDQGRATKRNLLNEFETKEDHMSSAVTPASLGSCKFMNVPGSSRLRVIREIHSKDFFFFLRRQEDFVRLVIEPKIKHVLETAEDVIELHGQDLEDPQADWVEVRVQYFQQLKHLRPDTLGLRVTVGNSDHYITTKHWSFLNEYEGFILFAEGGVELLFHCTPEEYFEEDVPSPFLWLIAGCLMSLILILTALGCIVVMYIKSQTPQQKENVSSPPSSLVYEEFDEEMLARIQQKVEALREGRVSESSDSGGKENRYVLQVTPKKDSSIPDTHSKGLKCPNEDRYKVPRSSNRGRCHQVRPQTQKYTNDPFSPDENHYETLYPLDNSTTVSHGVPRVQTRNATEVLSQSPVISCSDKVDFIYEDNIYEQLYLAA